MIWTEEQDGPSEDEVEWWEAGMFCPQCGRWSDEFYCPDEDTTCCSLCWLYPPTVSLNEVAVN